MPETKRRIAIVIAVVAILLAAASFIGGFKLYGQHGNPMADKFFAFTQPIAILGLCALLIWLSR